MAVYLKKFETQAAYEAAQSGLILPNVSLIADNNTVHYNPSTPTPSHDFVEIGGVKWATMNVGANSITDTGLYFQWGDISGYTAAQVGSGEGKKYFGWTDYKYGNGTSSPGSTGMTKYNSTDDKTVLDAADDAARANWGGKWRMPTKDDLQALSAATTNAWTSITVDNVTVSGRLFTDKTDSTKTLFFPACGSCSYGGVMDVGSYGYYWSSSFDSSNALNAYDLFFVGGGVYWQHSTSRYIGYPVRGVVNE